MRTVCCQCGRVKGHDGEWTGLHALPRPDDSHGYCPECMAALVELYHLHQEALDASAAMGAVIIDEAAAVDEAERIMAAEKGGGE